MPYRWPADTDFALWELDVLDRDCPACGRHDVHLRSPVSPPPYPGRAGGTGLQAQPLSRSRPVPDTPRPRAPNSKSPSHCPRWAIGWDVFCWIGHRRCSRHMGDLLDPVRTPGRLPDQALGRRHRASTSDVTRSCSRRGSKTPRLCGGSTNRSTEIILSIDGLQPEKGHETLYVVRELTQKRVWFAEPLISATAGRGPTPDRSRPRSGPNPWASRWGFGCRTSRMRS